MFRRVLVFTTVIAVGLGLALLTIRPEREAPSGAPSLDEMAAALGTPVMTHIVRGHVPDRSGEVLLVPKPHNFLLGNWDLSTLGTSDLVPGSSHPNPWDYLTEVPIVLAGPGVERGTNSDPVDIADIAPTYASMLGLDLPPETQGRPLPDVSPDGEQPKLIFTVVIDGGGWNVLQEHPEIWPNIAALMDRGTTYTAGTIGSAPSITGALHATFGTGAYPDVHGIPGNQLRDDDGVNQDAYLEDADPRFLNIPTISELWDEATDNEAVVGTVSYEGWHLGMIGHGAQRPGGDRDIGVLWHQDDQAWGTNEEFYELPEYLQETDLTRLAAYEDALDGRDGLVDGTWFGETIAELRPPNIRPGTPAFVQFTGDAVVDVIKGAGLGSDGITDLFWVEMKMPDYAGHRWNMASAQQEAVVAEVDRQIGRFMAVLDRQVGRDSYVFGLSADHGQQPLPELVGGWRINNRELEHDIEARFGPIIEKVTTVDIYFDAAALRAEDTRLEDVARFLATYTIEDNLPDDDPGRERVPVARLSETLFAGAFTSEYLASLTAEELSSFGRSEWPQGNFPLTER